MLLFVAYYNTNGPYLYRNCGRRREYKMVDRDNIKFDYPQGKILQSNLRQPYKKQEGIAA